ncbi:uncharacterized protein [Pyxicephalus adspersus]|uniref:uncharacterized protein n=1 Tax=Pyxicephalus adspersus TaxID=30357 RepID=UPI003B5C4576
MFSPAKRQRQENILIRLCDKFTRTEVNVICPVIKAEHSVRVLYKLQEKLLKDILQTAGDENGLSLQQVHCIPLPNSKGLQFNLFIEYASSTKTDTNNRQELRKTLDTKLSTVLRGTFTLIDELEDMDQIVPQPIISEVDFELHKLMSCANDLEKESEALPDLCIAAEAIYSMLEELKESYTKFAVLSQNGKGKSFILNLLLLMTADNNEEYLNNNRDIQLPEVCTIKGA